MKYLVIATLVLFAFCGCKKEEDAPLGDAVGQVGDAVDVAQDVTAVDSALDATVDVAADATAAD